MPPNELSKLEVIQFEVSVVGELVSGRSSETVTRQTCKYFPRGPPVGGTCRLQLPVIDNDAPDGCDVYQLSQARVSCSGWTWPYVFFLNYRQLDLFKYSSS